MTAQKSEAMRTWAVALVAIAALILSGMTWLSGDRLGVERRVSALEGEAAASRESLSQIRQDVREIRQFLLGKGK